tara:strand:+ start:79 stop:342 length:264 start_codon:yes stop_codon:yes gene_type:complete
MRQFIYNSWNGVMDADHSPLKNIPDVNTRHMILQVLAWMWCIAFGLWLSSLWMFGFSAIIHIILLAAIAVTVGTFHQAENNPEVFNK